MEAIAGLPVIAALPGAPHQLELQSHTPVCRRYLPQLSELVKEAFPAVDRVSAAVSPDRCHLNFTGWHATRGSRSMLWGQALWAAVPPGDLPDPWLPLRVPSRGRRTVVVSRSGGAHNSFFPWPKVLEHYQNCDLVFCGPKEAFEDFTNEFDARGVRWAGEQSLVEAAREVAAAQLVVANQNEVALLADGCGRPLVLELSLVAPDMLTSRRGLFPSFAGRAFLPDVPTLSDNQGVWVETPLPAEVVDVIVASHPQGGWRFKLPDRGSEDRYNSMEFAVRLVSAALGVPLHRRHRVREAILQYNLQHYPAAFVKSDTVKVFRRVKQAFEWAGLADGYEKYFSLPDLGKPEVVEA